MLSSGLQAPETGIVHQGATATAIVFFKVSCPVCQLALPFLDRIAAQSGSGLRIVAVSQDDAASTAEFRSELGIGHLEMQLDPPPYKASQAFQISSVPSLFVIEPEGRISQTIEGFSKAGFEELGQRAGVTVFTPADRVPNLRPG